MDTHVYTIEDTIPTTREMVRQEIEKWLGPQPPEILTKDDL